MYYMRTILNISLPKEMADELKRDVKREGFASTSEFIRSLVREYKKAKFAESLRAQVKDYEKNPHKWKVIRSGKDLG